MSHPFVDRNDRDVVSEQMFSCFVLVFCGVGVAASIVTVAVSVVNVQRVHYVDTRYILQNRAVERRTEPTALFDAIRQNRVRQQTILNNNNNNKISPVSKTTFVKSCYVIDQIP